jgi:hypothetical protein
MKHTNKPKLTWQPVSCILDGYEKSVVAHCENTIGETQISEDHFERNKKSNNG